MPEKLLRIHKFHVKAIYVCFTTRNDNQKFTNHPSNAKPIAPK